MKRFSYDRLEANAEREISAASVPPRKLVLYHSLITAGAVLLAALVQLLLQNQIDNTGGLSGMDSRAVLSRLYGTPRNFLAALAREGLEHRDLEELRALLDQLEEDRGHD